MAACSLNVIGNNHIWDSDSGFYVYHMIFTNGAVIQVPMFTHDLDHKWGRDSSFYV